MGGACLFKARPGVLSKTLSHMWGKLNLPMFLFNVGLLTVMKMDSYMFNVSVKESIFIVHLQRRLLYRERVV